MTALAPTATHHEVVLWLAAHVDKAILANLVVVFLEQDIEHRDGLLEQLAEVWQLKDPEGWLQFSSWAARRATV
ncbi:hypothetical protein [Rhodococcoides kyotonense]|uniref:Uncharacterized protein n=1 Tax=Rhodococcoides kyotonense TaxID=398843 RepID=A0A239FSK2_9NOCA|nr:hypothetical protein [Rhodococcus kyotonensis]SNS58834.1 hypothetical protein SAMN05421642_103399 [Rhodococcus kyotonensis]